MFKSAKLKLWLSALALLAATQIQAEDAFYKIALKDLKFTSGELPKRAESAIPGFDMRDAAAMSTYAVIDGEGEVCLGGNVDVGPWILPDEYYHDAVLAVRAPAGKDVSGRLFVPKADFSGMTVCTFKLAADTASPGAKRDFYLAKKSQYERLLGRDIPGAAWFRHQVREAERALGTTNAAAPEAPLRPGRMNESADLYSLFSGGRAVSENLQLDRALRATKAGDATVDIASLAGITVKAMDWKSLVKDLKPETDPLAACIPGDQHAIFFRSFAAMTQLMDEADAHGTPLLAMFEPRAEDRDSKGHYQKQLCLGLGDVSRLLGPAVIQSAAFTGSDPYLRTGTDVGILFESATPDAVKTVILARQAAAIQANPEVKAEKGEIGGVAFTAAVAADRSICSYLAVKDKVVLVSNSRAQLARLLAAASGKTPAIAAQDEYIWFRNRYSRADKTESAFIILTDATIRRWCGAQWRIGAARRTRAAAALAELQAAHLAELVGGTVKPGPITPDFPFNDGGDLTLTTRGVNSSVYGNLDFLTPISELDLAKVTPEEADNYKRWRDTYQQNWNQYFDPIAARFSFSPTNAAMEISVMPLILRSEYGQFFDFANGAAIAPDAGDPHAGALAHLAVSLNADSDAIKKGGNLFGTLAPGIKANPFGWLGQTVAVFADDDSFWDELAKTEDLEKFLSKAFPRLPIALHCEVRNSLGLTAFLTSMRAFAEQTAPDMTKWSNGEYNGHTYVKITAANPDAGADEPANVVIYYAATPKSFVLTLNENVLKHSLDRLDARATNAASPILAGAPPWLGTNLCLHLDQRLFRVIGKMWRENAGDAGQRLAWNNLPILNEWKRLFPAQDPVKLHAQFWLTRLVTPGGGDFVWNDKWQTMESTVYGNPGEPKKGPDAFGPWLNISNANLGVSFEHQGISAKAVIHRPAAAP